MAAYENRLARRRPGVQACVAQTGFALLELALALALTSMLLIWSADRVVHQIDDVASRAHGVWLLELKRGLDTFLTRHYESLADGLPPVNAQGQPIYADPFAPQLAELRAQGHLSAGFPDAGALGHGVAIRILRDAGCPDAGCRLDALAYGNQPVSVTGGAPDAMRLGGVLEAVGGHGGSATADRIKGAGFNFPNPPVPGMPTLAPGTLAVWAGFSSSDYDLYVRRRDARDPDLQGPLTVAGGVSTQGRLHAGEYLSVGGTASAGTVCPAGNGGLFARGAAGGLLECRHGRWANLGGAFGGAYVTTGSSTCGAYAHANPVTGNCSCPAGYTAVRVSTDPWSPDGTLSTAYICVGVG